MSAKDPKSLAMLVLGRKPKDDVEGEEEEVEEESDDGLKVAAEEVLSAVKADDADGLVKAMKAFVGMCSHAAEE